MTKRVSLFARDVSGIRDKDFLKAAMAACALTILADGNSALSERFAIDDLLARMERLQLYDPQKAIAILDDFVYRLRSDEAKSRHILLAKIERLAKEREAAELIPQIVTTVALADGKVSAHEFAMLRHICVLLQVDSADYEEALLAAAEKRED